MADWELQLWNAANTSLVTTLDPVTDGVGIDQRPRFQKVGNDMGGGSFSLALDAPTVPSQGQVIRVYLNSVAWFGTRVTGVRVISVSPEEDAGEVIAVTCDGLLVDYSQAVIQRNVAVDFLPAEDDRVVGWPSVEYTEVAAWENATTVAVQGWASTYYEGLPAGWKDPAALWILDGSGDDTDAPDSVNWHFRDAVTLASDVANLVIEFAGDNRVTAYWNGVLKGQNADFRAGTQIELGPASAGTHIFAAFLENAPDDGPPGGNPAASIWTVTNGVDGAVLARSDTSVQVLPYTEPLPGQTEGEIVRLLVADCPNISGVTLNFSDTNATGSTAWPSIYLLPLRVGTKMDAHLRSRAESVIDFDIAANGTLSMWVKGVRGSASSLSLITADSTAGIATPTSVNVGELEWDDDGTDQFDALLVKYREGRFMQRPVSTPALARFGFVTIDADAAEAAVVADALLATYGAGAGVATVGFYPTSVSQWPGTAFDVWDTVAVPTAANPNTTSSQRVKAITFQVDADGFAEFIIELGSLVIERRELLDRQIQSLSGGGALGGLAETARQVAPTGATVSPARVSTVTFGSEPFPATGDSGSFNFPFPCRVAWFRVTAKTPSGTTTLQIRRNSGGTVVSTLSLGSSATSDFDDGVDTTTTTVENWDWNTTAVGGHTGLVITAGVTPIGT